MSARRIITPLTVLFSWLFFGAGAVFSWAVMGTSTEGMIGALVFTAAYSFVVWINGVRPERSSILDVIDA